METVLDTELVNDAIADEDLKTQPAKVNPEELLKTVDSRDWAKAFMKTIRETQNIEIDYELMLCWFSSAIMVGFDEGVKRGNPANQPDFGLSAFSLGK